MKRVYDINLNYLGVNPPLAPPPPWMGSQESGGKEEEERVVEGESFLFALLSGQDMIPLFTNATIQKPIIAKGRSQRELLAQLDEPHRHNQNPVGTFHGTSLLWCTEMKTAVNPKWVLCSLFPIFPKYLF
ncbi:MAG: hypothetical protein F6K23_25835 [Okeania sp. SIO2C9]|uniref:hypothetical protein n=1 Tax=Okeania sp. SIO2C9 TaxID=2607791 RepID=UPI0013C07863|nr:hypothetical protein [Okeania sp. SIO2C9]NEQ76156.1 hypothetical protein [Okeania sp. SIO2C9]